jgi:hypothetical protein
MFSGGALGGKGWQAVLWNKAVGDDEGVHVGEAKSLNSSERKSAIVLKTIRVGV